MQSTICFTKAVFIVAVLPAALCAADAASTPAPQPPRIVSRVVTADAPSMYGATYLEPTGLRLGKPGSVSDDNGRTWKSYQPTPDFAKGLPYGYRREGVTATVEPKTGRLLYLVNALDTPGLDPASVEPPIAEREYYLRYRVSDDGGRTWLFDERIIHAGPFTAKNPFTGIVVGKNGFYLGDAGCIPIVTRSGRILIPLQASMLDKDGKFYNPTGQTTFTDVFVILGAWGPQGRIVWKASPRVQAAADRSTRGLIEPTLAQFGDGRILMVMRGSNAGNAKLPSYRWFSVSQDDGETWSEPKPWTYDDGKPMFSPSSMSVLVKHSSGRVFWVGNTSPTNCDGNNPRWPVVFGEVEPGRLRLRRGSVIEVDAKRPEDQRRGRELLGTFDGQLDLSHFWVFEDRQTGEFVLTYPRAFGGYKKSDWATVRIALAK